MAVLAYIESNKSKPKKNSYEIISYGRGLADKLSTELIVLSFNIDSVEDLSNYGPDKILNIKNNDLSNFNIQKYADVIAQACNSLSIDIIIIGGSADSKYLAPSLSVKTNSSYVSNVVELPSSLEPFTLKRSTYSNKAFSDITIKNEKKLIGIYNNSFGIVEKKSNPELISIDIIIPDSTLTTDSVEHGSGDISIADADIVVSAGRGLKGPENWNIIEDLAKTLGAATACSKPVSDMGWRPHSEHVGQTGKPVATNLYIAIGISGAIQHLAGVSSSKVKVVINTDPEAPFFKAADYGIIGDAFDVVPKLNEKLKVFKAGNN
ncbi:MAG: electron transfer flavoprotein subunit alpha [Flavobacteriaceae bacterium]|nr:electron transfer flavoprotein subunit alpha [Flavobacteriaceae bacterium]